jgi:ribose transport system permease protein
VTETSNVPEFVSKSKLIRLVATLGPLFGLLTVYLLFILIAPPSFSTLGNLQTIARQSTIVGIASLGMTLVIISGGIDLSVGSTIAMTTVIVAWLLEWTCAGPLLSGLGGIVASALVGLIIGLLIAKLRIVPFIVTLGMMLLIRGVSKGIASEQKIDAPLTWLNDLLAAGRSWQWPPGVWIMLILALLVAGMLRYTALGRHIFAVGSNEQTARLCGIRVERVKVLVYTLNGTLAGLAGLMQFSRLTVGDPTVAVGKELDVIAAVVIGGGSLSGGEGSILGSIIGALIMTVIRSGCSQMGLPNWVQEIITGVIIVLAVALDRLRKRKIS